MPDDDLAAEAEIYDQNLMNSERLMKLFQNADITPQFVEGGSDQCVKLTVTDAYTGEPVEEAYFACENHKKFDLLEIKKVE